MPVLPELALRPLQAMDHAGLIHWARKWTVVSVRGPGAVYTDTPTIGPEIPARLNPISPDSPLRGDQPSAAKRFWLSVPSGTALAAGDKWQVAGTMDGVDWTREVSVSEVEFPKSHGLRRRAIVVDVASNP